MLARKEWNEPERREPMYPRVQPDSFRVFCGYVGIALLLWAVVLFPLLDALQRHSVQYNIARFGLN